MRKLSRVAASALAVAMATTMVAGCSSSSSTADTTTKGTEEGTAATTGDAGATAAPDASSEEAPSIDTSNEGKVLNIYCWNDEYATRLQLMPGYVANKPYVSDEEKGDPLAGGKIGDVEVKFTQVASDDGAYQKALDAALDGLDDAADDDKVDLFLVEADYALKYVDDEITADVYKFISKDDTKDQYKYTQDIMTDSNGTLKGVSWQACPGLMFYNRDIAKEVLGSDDPETVQAAVKDWATFNETAAKVAEKGYLMESSVNDSYRVYSNNVSKPWVVDGVITIDDNIKKWVDDSKKLFDAKQTTNDALWDGYNNSKNGGCFCSFGPAWLINFCFGFEKEDPNSKNLAEAGKWGAVVGPQSFYWGGTWMCAVEGTDNPTLVGEIFKALTCNVDIMKEIVTKYDDFVNNQAAMEEMAKSDYKSYKLGNMNPLGLYAEGAKAISLDTLSIYDQTCNEKFQDAMKAYFAGDSSYEEALEGFYKAVIDAQPSLKKPE